MRVPLSWLREYAALADPVDPDEVARRLTAIGLEIEAIERVGHDVSNVVVARVLEIEELTGFNKPIRYCRVSYPGPGPAGSVAGWAERQVICGASNFAVDDVVPLALPGATLPGGFEIGARKAYGRMSDGMICSAAELALGDDHSGIIVLPPDTPLGVDFVQHAGLRDVVFDVNVTPDKGHAMSVRGIARELATAFGVDYTDPADAGGPVGDVSDQVYPASIADPAACDRFVLREVRGIDPARPTPLIVRVRLARAGMRSVSLAVDVTNYLMLELGQPLHAFDRSALNGPIVVRRAQPGEELETLDHLVRQLDPDDIVIADSSGPISLAGTMGGLATEITGTSTDLVIEAAHFSATGVARMSRRHRLPSEASARFERGVDYELPVRASAKAAAMLAELGGGDAAAGYCLASAPVEPARIVIPADHPDRVAGVSYGAATVIGRLREAGCEVSQDGDLLTVRPPSWRPDLTDPNDLAEEVIRFEGYDRIGIRMPRAVAGRGRTATQRLRIEVGRALAGVGYVEVSSTPFAAAADFDRLQLAADDPRRRAIALANPIRDEEPLLRTTLLPGLFRVLSRNLGRGFADLALTESGTVFLARPDGPDGRARVAPILAVDRAPTPDELALLQAAIPDQPRQIAVVLTGQRDQAGWWGQGRPASCYDAIEAARTVLRVSRLAYTIRAARREPWHPGRCAAFYLERTTGDPSAGTGAGSGAGELGLAAGPGPAAGLGLAAERGLAAEPGSAADSGPDAGLGCVGYAGELHPRVIAAFGLPPRTCAMELDLSAIERAAARLAPVQAPAISAYPVASQDVALVVGEAVPAAEVEAALVAGAATAGTSALLEDVRLFDVYAGQQAGPGRKSLAYTMRFRAPDRTLTADEVTLARDAAVAEAARLTGASLRTS